MFKDRRNIGLAFGVTTVATVAIAGTLLESTEMPLGAAPSAPSASSSNCGEFTGKIDESQVFTPYEMQRSHLPDVLLNPSDAGARDADSSPEVPPGVAVASVAGKDRRWVDVAQNGSVAQYFSDRAIDRDASLWQFQVDGGIELDFTPTAAMGMSLADVKELLGDRAVPIEVGPHDGIIVWGDPNSPTGTRLHHVYWHDDDGLWDLAADMSPEAAISSSRRIACR